MEREKFLAQVKHLGDEGKTIRAIAAELGVHRSRVQRALASLALVKPPEDGRPSSQGSSWLSVFVGRQREMALLSVALDEALSGSGRLAMLVGEPGIGKTRTAQELAAIARQRGALVLWGRCYEGEGAPPYWPWVQCIRAYAEASDAQALSEDIGAGAADIAEIVPDVKQKLQGLQPAPTLEPQQARFRLFDCITTFFKRASRRRPLLMALDNLHLADRASLLLLEFLAPEIASSPILLLGTYRDIELSRRHPLSQTLGELVKDPSGRFQRLILRGLSREDVGQFIRLMPVANPDERMVSTIYEQTEGNPFFVSEVVRLLSEEGTLSASDDARTLPTRIPEGVREAIGRRLDRLSETCNEVLAIASVIGREFDLNQLTALDDIPGDELLDALDEAVRAYLIEETTGRYSFTHALVQQTLVSEMTTSRRIRLHARIAEALLRLYGDNAEAHAAALTHHYSEASALVGPERMVHYSLLAGEQALAAYAWEDAQAHFERALKGKEGQLTSTGSESALSLSKGQGMDGEAAAIASGLGHALAALNQHQQAATHMRRAFVAYYAEVGDVARALATVDPYPSYLLIQLKDTLAQALELVPADSLQSARLLCSYGLSVGARGNGYAQGQEALEAALAIARREGDTALEMRVMSVSANVDGYHMKWQQCLNKSLRALELATQGEHYLVDKRRAHSWVCNSSFATGDPEKAEEHITEAYAIAEPLRNVFDLVVALSRRRILAYLCGEWEALHALGDRYTNDLSNGVLAMALYQTGDFDKGKACMHAVTEPVNRLDRSRAFWSLVAASFCYISGETDLLAGVEAAARDAIANHELPPVVTLEAQAALAQVAVLRHDASSAAEQYAALKLYPNTVTWTGAICIDRLLGLLAHTMGILDAARTHFEDALAFCRKAGYRPELAWTCYDYATMLADAGKTLLRANPKPALSSSKGQTREPATIDSREIALSLLDEAIAISTALGMNPLMERVAALRKTIETWPASARKYPASLTERQVEVLRLVAEGKTSREIAEMLVLSERTVHRHIDNIYTKISARNRTEATAFALRELYPIK
jgi:DNA-binding CsgD family transcriptional regulator/tetratricopeptide (TPR) repeat protein